MELQTFTLPNGIRLVHLPAASQVSHCGLFINAGTRDETSEEHGIAHFIEHTIFKGTEKRNLFQVLNRLENVGADLNAYTSKEETCIYASFLSDYYDRTLELFQDIFFHSVFPEKELQKEKLVIMDEIRSYKDTPAEQIFDDFEDLLFSGHPLGRNILGTSGSLRRMKRNDILAFIERNYQLDEVIIVSVGNIAFQRLKKLATKYFSCHPHRIKAHPRVPFKSDGPRSKSIRKKITQVHCILGATAYSYTDERRISLALLNNMLGGPIMNSRLSLALRERNGLTYHNESNYTAYSDSGIFTIYFGTDPLQYERALSVVFKELKKIREKKLSSSQLRIIQKQIEGQLAIARESNLSTMMAIGKNYLLQGQFEPFETITRKIEAVTASQIIAVANEIFTEENLTMLTFKP